MTIKVSTKGRVILPGPLRRKLGISAGDTLVAKIESEGIVLIPERKNHVRQRSSEIRLQDFLC